MKAIECHRDLIDELDGNTVVANGIGDAAGDGSDCTPVRVGQWKLSNRIPPEYWPRLIEMAAEKGLDGITLEWFVQTLPPRQKAKPAAEQADAA